MPESLNSKKGRRKQFRNAVFKRDNYRCKMCNASGDLDAHHITDRNEMPNGGYVAENGISLCPSCHLKAEVWHSSGNTKYETGYSVSDLYNKIGSTFELAVKKSEQLK